MTVLVFSDSHGISRNMAEAVRRAPMADAILFAGDGVRDLMTVADESALPIFAVRGNNDLSLFGCGDYGEEELLTLGGKRILLCHGHRHGVRYGTEALAKHAAALGADIAVFGHTHCAYEGQTEIDGRTVYLFNPGSIGMRKENGSYSFGVITIDRMGRVLLSHGEI